MAERGIVSPCPKYRSGCSCPTCGAYDRALLAKVPRPAVPLDDIEGMDIEDGRAVRTFKVGPGGVEYDIRERPKRGQA